MNENERRRKMRGVSLRDIRKWKEEKNKEKKKRTEKGSDG